MSLFWIARNVIKFITVVFYRGRATGTDNITKTGPLIVACNHVSYFDPPMMGVFVPREIHYMAKKELFEIPVLGPAIRAVGTYPVDREGSATAAIKRSVEELRAGNCIGIFPEGGRNLEGDKEARAGVALLASLGKAPVVPAAIVGSRNARPFVRPIKVAFGPPMSLPAGRKATRDELEKFTESVMSAISALAESIGGNS